MRPGWSLCAVHRGLGEHCGQERGHPCEGEDASRDLMPSERATRIDSLSCAAVQAGGQEGGGRQGVGQEERVEGLVQ